MKNQPETPEALAHALFTAAQLAPGEGIEDAVGRLAALVEAQQHARIADLEAQLEAIGAGGVNGPLIGQPQAMPDLTALTERGAKAWAGVDAQAGAVPLTCEWTHNDDDGFWESACGEAWRFDDGGPAENSMHFCHSCGKSLRIKGKEAGNADA